MRSSLVVVLIPLAAVVSAAACTSSDSNAPAPSPDASTLVVDGGATGDGATATDSAPTDGATTDAPTTDTSTSDATNNDQPFCQTAAATGAAFCADFEGAAVDDGWDELTVSGDATMTLDTSVAKQKKSAHAEIEATGGAAVFSTIVNAGGSKSKAVIEFDAYIHWPNLPPTTNMLMLTIALRTGTGAGGYFIDIERTTSGWQVLRSGASGVGFPAFSQMAWHHFRLSYDGSAGTGGQADINLFIDNSNVVAIKATKGTGAADAPASFDNMFIEHLGLDTDTATSFYVDNVIVTYP